MFTIQYQNDRNAVREELSYAALHALITQARGSCKTEARGADAAGVDASCLFMGAFSPEPRALTRVAFGVQLKATSGIDKPVKQAGAEFWSLKIDVKLAQKYSEPGNAPLILVLALLPKEEEFDDWLRLDEKQLIMKARLYWTPLEGFATPENQKTTTIYVPKKNLLTPEAILNEIVVPLALRKELKYETP